MSGTNYGHLGFCDFFWAGWLLWAVLGALGHLNVSIIPVFQGGSNGDGPESSFDVYNAQKCNSPHFAIIVR